MRVGVRNLQGRGSINVQAYVDVRKLASLGEWMVKKGLLSRPMQYGRIVQQCLDLVLRQIEEESNKYETIGDALNWLESMGFPMGQFEGYGRRNIVKALQEEAYQAEVGRPTPLKQTLAGRPGYNGPFLDQAQLERDVAKALADLDRPETLEEAIVRRAREDEERKRELRTAQEHMQLVEEGD